MLRRLGSAASCAAVTLILAGATAAQDYTEDFESFPLGPIEGTGIWTNWTGANGNLSQVVNTFNHTSGGSQSLEVTNGADTIADFDALPGGSFDSGSWTLSVESFVPTGSTGNTSFLVMNQWDVTGSPAYEWNLWIGLNSATNRAELNTPAGLVQTPLVVNAWAEIRAEYDLDSDSVTVFYNGIELATYDPRCGVLAGCAGYSGSFIDAVDFYPDPATGPSPVYFDDLRVEEGDAVPGTPVCFGDGSGSPCGCLNESDPLTGGCRNSVSGTEGALATVASGTAGQDQTANPLAFQVTNVRTQPGLFFSANNTIGGGAGATFGDGLRCCGGGLVRVENINPPVGPEPVTVTTTATFTPAPPGTKRCYQYWYRDPGGPCGTNFNLSNAVTVTWGP